MSSVAVNSWRTERSVSGVNFHCTPSSVSTGAMTMSPFGWVKWMYGVRLSGSLGISANTTSPSRARTCSRYWAISTASRSRPTGFSSDRSSVLMAVSSPPGPTRMLSTNASMLSRGVLMLKMWLAGGTRPPVSVSSSVSVTSSSATGGDRMYQSPSRRTKVTSNVWPS